MSRRSDVRGGLKLEGLVKRFGDVTAVAGVDLELPPGKLISFLGPSGCGKTTMLRMIAGLEHPSEGRIFLDDEDVTDRPAYTRDIGMVFQSLAFFPHLNVAGNIGYGLRIRGAEKDRISSRVDELLRLVSLEGMSDRRIQQLSGGSASAWPPPARWRSNRDSSCSMSRSPRSTRTCASSSRWSSGCSNSSWGSPRSSSRTTSGRR